MNTVRFVSFNREIPAMRAGAPEWAHLVPFGDYPGNLVGQDGGETAVIQRCDRAALDAIMKNFRPKLLVDFEHRSAFPGGDTSAAAWILNLEIREDGLWGRLDLSDLGEQAIVNKRYRHLSPAFEVAEVDVSGSDSAHADALKIVRPIKLVSAGLTNRHNLKALQPLTNAEPQRSEVRASEEKQQQAEQARKDTMKDIATALGLDSAAEKPAVLNAIKALATAKTDLDAARAKVAELEGSILNQEADAFVAANAPKIKDAKAVKKQFVANKEATVALFASLADAPAPAAGKAPAVTHNRAAAQTPAGGQVLNQADAQKALVAVIRNREKCDHKTAFNLARAEKPELFQEEKKEE